MVKSWMRKKKFKKQQQKCPTSDETPVSLLISWLLVPSVLAPAPVWGAILGIANTCSCISSLPAPVCSPSRIMASPPETPSVVPPGPSVVWWWLSEFHLLLPVALCVTADRWWLRHGCQVNLAALWGPQWGKRAGVEKYFLVTPITTKLVVVTRAGGLWDDVR